MSNKSDTQFLDVLRWLATIAVVFYHTCSAAVSYVGVSDLQRIGFKLVKDLRLWAVPIFVMISGGLLLRKERQIGYPTVFRKYIRRVALALLLFGYPMALLEEFFHTRVLSFIMLFRAAHALLTGDLWDHMWYLYMLIGLYLITPVLKSMIQAASEKEFFIFLVILFIFTSVLPSFSAFTEASFGVYIPIIRVYLFYYLAGYYFLNVFDVDRFRSIHYLIIILACWAIMIAVDILRTDYVFSNDSPVCVILSLGLFCLARRMKWRSAFLSKTKFLCFGIYLTHMVFINFVYKFLKITPFSGSVCLTVPLFTLFFLFLSTAASYILNRIPPLKKYVL